MEKNLIITHDGSLQGLLSSVYVIFEKKLTVADIQPLEKYDSSLLFGAHMHIPTNTSKAKRVWDSLGNKGSEAQRYVYFSYLSERPELQHYIYQYINILFQKKDTSWDLLFKVKEKLSPWAHRVGTEKRYLEANMKFERTSDGVLLSSITPVYNILPLLTRYCRNRFGREPWALFDEKREFGMRNLHGQIIRYENTCKPKVGRDASIPLSSVSDSGKQISHTIGQSDQHGYNASALRMYA